MTFTLVQEPPKGVTDRECIDIATATLDIKSKFDSQVLALTADGPIELEWLMSDVVIGTLTIIVNGSCSLIK